jgi:hypothetical protein
MLQASKAGNRYVVRQSIYREPICGLAFGSQCKKSSISFRGLRARNLSRTQKTPYRKFAAETNRNET